MRIRAVVALARGSERLLARQVDPQLPGFRRHLVQRVIRTLDEQEGRHLRHTLSALVAVGLSSLGVVGDRFADEARPGLTRVATTGVLDTTRLPHRPPSPRPEVNPARRWGGLARVSARAPLACRGGP